ncbi:MAG: hypothetical protein ACLPYS_20770, partial [Vulcanimicrobiaceae bacterium]
MKASNAPKRDAGSELRAAIEWVAAVSTAPHTLSFVASLFVCNEGDAEAVTRDWEAFIVDCGREYAARKTTSSPVVVSGRIVRDSRPIEGRRLHAFSQREGLLWVTSRT